MAELTKGERTRQALLEVAIRRFAAEGYQRTSVSDVARDVGLTPAAVYAYFPGKEALFLAAVDADAEGLVAVALQALEHPVSDDLGETIVDLTSRVALAARDHPLVARVLRHAEQMPISRTFRIASLGGLLEQLTAFMEAGQQLGAVRDDLDPATLALGLETIVLLQLPVLVSADEEEDRDDERWRAVAAVMAAAVTVPGAAPAAHLFE